MQVQGNFKVISIFDSFLHCLPEMSPGKGALCKNFNSKHLKNKLKHKKYWF